MVELLFTSISEMSSDRASWTKWFVFHPKDFLDTTALWVSIAVNSLIAFLTFQLYRANRSQIKSSTQQNTRLLLGSKFEEALATIDSTNELLEPIYKEIMEKRDLYIRNGISNAQAAIELKRHAVLFGQRLQLYSLKNVDDAYKNWLNVVIAIMNMVEEIEGKSQHDTYGSLSLAMDQKGVYVERTERLFQELKDRRDGIMVEMRSVVKVDPN